MFALPRGSGRCLSRAVLERVSVCCCGRTRPVGGGGGGYIPVLGGMRAKYPESDLPPDAAELYGVGIDAEEGGRVVIRAAGSVENGDPGVDEVYGDGGPGCC